jgi:hypothetical protein
MDLRWTFRALGGLDKLDASSCNQFYRLWRETVFWSILGVLLVSAVVLLPVWLVAKLLFEQPQA